MANFISLNDPTRRPLEDGGEGLSNNPHPRPHPRLTDPGQGDNEQTQGEKTGHLSFGDLPNNLRWGGSGGFTPVNPRSGPVDTKLRLTSSGPFQGELEVGELGEWNPQPFQPDWTTDLRDLQLTTYKGNGPGPDDHENALVRSLANLQFQHNRFEFLALPAKEQGLVLSYFLAAPAGFLPLGLRGDGSLCVATGEERRWPLLPLLLTSRDVYLKAVSFFYGETLFSFEDFGTLAAFLCLPPHLLEHVRHFRFGWPFFAQDDGSEHGTNLFVAAAAAVPTDVPLTLHVTAPSFRLASPEDKRVAALAALLDQLALGDNNALDPFLFVLLRNVSAFSYALNGRWETVVVGVGNLQEFNRWLAGRGCEATLTADGAWWLENVVALLFTREFPAWAGEEEFWG